MLTVTLGAIPRAAAAVVVPRETVSHYERAVSAGALYQQGVVAGREDEQGIVILDFGRPAFDGVENGTLDYTNAFVSLRSIAVAVESFATGYLRSAPSDTVLDIAVGTNDSCGAGQPCGHAICGCIDEPADYNAWGRSFATTVVDIADWVAGLSSSGHFTDQVRVVAGDDAEPGFDPGYENTYNLLAGYAAGVGGTSPAMIDYGSADASYWTEPQLLQVAYGFAPDVPMPEIYLQSQVREWATLVHYARSLHRTVTLFGVLTPKSATVPDRAYTSMLAAVRPITGQQQIAWLSEIT